MVTSNEDAGTVYWITGLAGAGKTTIGRLFTHWLKEFHPNLVFLDGDAVREVIGNNVGHGREDRLKLSMCYSRLCRLLSEQGIDVVCATVSLFHEVRNWNRRHLRKYKEIYVRAPLDVLIKRDQKALYSRALSGANNDVVGMDLPFEEPRNPDVVLDNDGSRAPEEMVVELCAELGLARSETTNEN